MRINLTHGVLLGILAASFGVLGTAPAQASATAGTSVPAASHHVGTADRILLRSDRFRCDGDWWGNGWWGDRCDFGHFHNFGDFDHFRHFGDFDHFGDFGHGGGGYRR